MTETNEIDDELSEAGGENSIFSSDSSELLGDARKEVEERRRNNQSGNVRQSATSELDIPESDETLFRYYQQGDQRAFLIVYNRYKSPIFAYCARILFSAGLSRDLVEDTFQDVFLRLAQYQHTFVGGEFRAWIYTIARHSCLSAKKKAIRHRITTELVGDAENLDDDVTPAIRAALSRTDDPLERMSKKEQADLVLRAIQELPETYREALILSDYEGMTYDEIGKLTGTSLSTIRIRVFRAKARLRKVLLPILGDHIDVPRTPRNKNED